MSALKLLRTGSHFPSKINPSPCINGVLRATAAAATTRVLVAGICSKANYMGYQRPPPYPYKEKKFYWINHLFDKTTARFNENTKLVVVDGPIAAGKSTFARHLAEELDMLYSPEANHDSVYINDYGYDLRVVNKKLPVDAQLFDVKDFCRNPNHPNVGAFQLEMLSLRYEQYIDAMAHMLNTGQGVVMDRSVFSDFVFMEAMFESGYISKTIQKVHRGMWDMIKDYVKHPHLFIYLDIPVDLSIKRVKERGNEWEINSPTLNTKYLSSIDNHYKQTFLRNISQHSELLIYDWSNFGDVEVVVEDIEAIDFERFTPYDLKMADWRLGDLEWPWAELRIHFTNAKFEMLNELEPVGIYPELVLSADDTEALKSALSEVPGMKYASGYNPEMGDKVLFK